jgi:phosphoribosylformylglycinamidine synthase
MTANALVIAGYGLNCEEETAFAFEQVGFNSKILHINDLIENPNILSDIQVLSVPGGFSYGDDTGSGNAFAQKMRLTLSDALKSFIARETLTIGICNGCQIVVNLGLVPACGGEYGVRQVAVTHNRNARYQCRWVDLIVEPNKSPWLQNIDQLHVPVAHGEGRFMMAPEMLKHLDENQQIVLRYGKDGKPANGEFPFNPNGSTNDIAGMTDESGRVLVLMPHPERGMFVWQRDDYARLKDAARREGKVLPDTADGLALFHNAAEYFGINKMKKAF